MYAAVLAGAQNRRESTQPPQALGPCALNPAGRLPPFVVRFAAHASAVMDMTLQTSVALNRFALDGYVETVRHASAAITAMVRSVRAANAMTTLPPDDSVCAVAAMPTAAMQDSARKDADHVAGVAPTGRRRRTQSR